MSEENKEECCNADKSCDSEKEQSAKKEGGSCDSEKKPEGSASCDTDKGSCDAG